MPLAKIFQDMSAIRLFQTMPLHGVKFKESRAKLIGYYCNL